MEDRERIRMTGSFFRAFVLVSVAFVSGSISAAAAANRPNVIPITNQQHADAPDSARLSFPNTPTNARQYSFRNGDAKADVIFSQPEVSDIDDRVYVIERRPLGQWAMTSWQKSPFTADGKFVPFDWDPGEKTGLSIPDKDTRTRTQRGMRNAAGSTVCQMYGDTVGAYLNSTDLSGKGVDAKGNPLPGSNGYKQMVTPQYFFGPEEIIHPWREPDSRLQVSLDLQIPIAVCAEKKGSLAYANPLLTLVDPKTKLKISWGPMLFSKLSKGDFTRPLQNIAYDAPSRSWMIRDHLVPGASWLELAPDSASYQTAPWRGWRHFSWSISHAHIAAALKTMREQEPQVKISIDPGDYQLTSFHLNAETHFQTALAELGWSMRNLRIAVISHHED